MCRTGGTLVTFICVEGQCGDGTCEVGENVPCGCVEDCPGARWETTSETGVDASAADVTVDAGPSREVSDSRDAANGEESSAEDAIAPSGSCNGVRSDCRLDAECQAFDSTLSCVQGYCAPTGAKACGGAAGAGCEIAPLLTCVTIVGDFGLCLDDESAACFCAADAGFICAAYPTPTDETSARD